ncbi:MAG: hypothetical protein WC437_02260 [Patescibacteria group bacterium]|jgi:hypothetical protein|nr:hypothetical protein [Patescibacteria group bacterium]
MAKEEKKETAPVENTVAEPSVNASTTAVAPKKKNNTVLVVIIVIIAILVFLSIGGYFLSAFVFKKVAGNFVENIVEKGTGGNVKIDTKNGGAEVKTNEGSLNVGSAVKWPTDLPSDVPKFSAGKVTMSTKVNTDPKGWSVLVSEVNENDVTKYKNDLLAKGWVEESSMNYGATFIQLTKGNLEMTLTYDGSSKGLSITVSYKTT